jgi:hypothetical protein
VKPAEFATRLGSAECVLAKVWSGQKLLDAACWSSNDGIDRERRCGAIVLSHPLRTANIDRSIFRREPRR